MRRLFPKYLFFILLGILFLSGICFADEPKSSGIQGIEFLSGFAKAKLHEKGNYIMSPFVVDIDFDFKPIAKKIGINAKNLLQFQLEPYIAPVYEPESDIEIGNGFALKAGLLPETSKLQPYLKASIGFLYMTMHTREQSTQFNFFEYVGLGTQYYFNKSYAFTVEYRYRHASNCGLGNRNHGINSQFCLAGLAYKF